MINLRVEYIFHEIMKDNKSFQEKDNILSLLFGINK